ncbi:hypothetical protein ABD91_21030 [Lysinibacillus sphaericus]|uniref:hypothetical protein n=1 Tax=Lysinibacillus sphaericus TaxID=1421 RepID=UPI0018CDC2B1|nr:hypothetical protein [Lysinibacillus sphaericus]MBG9693225.1 hypothetical protein [Lysinibacillus sphaericus]
MNLLATSRKNNLAINYDALAALMIDKKVIRTFKDVETAVKPYHLVGIDAKVFIADVKKIHAENKGDKEALKSAVSQLLKRCLILKEVDYPDFRNGNELNRMIFNLQNSFANKELMVEEVNDFLKLESTNYRIQHEGGNLTEFVIGVQEILATHEYHEEQVNDIKKLFHTHFELVPAANEQEVTEKAIRTFSVWRTKQSQLKK